MDMRGVRKVLSKCTVNTLITVSVGYQYLIHAFSLLLYKNSLSVSSLVYISVNLRYGAK